MGNKTILFNESNSPPVTTLIDKSVAGTIYIGTAYSGRATSGAHWAIKKIVITSGAVTITLPNNSNKFDFIWDDRASLTYG